MCRAIVVTLKRGHLRAVEADADRLPLLERQPADVADDGPALVADRRRRRPALSESNTSHTVSARRNSAAGVAASNENVTRSPSLSRWALTVVAFRGSSFRRGSAAGGARRGSILCAAFHLAAGVSAFGLPPSPAGALRLQPPFLGASALAAPPALAPRRLRRAVLRRRTPPSPSRLRRILPPARRLRGRRHVASSLFGLDFDLGLLGKSFPTSPAPGAAGVARVMALTDAARPRRPAWTCAGTPAVEGHARHPRRRKGICRAASAACWKATSIT